MNKYLPLSSFVNIRHAVAGQFLKTSGLAAALLCAGRVMGVGDLWGQGVSTACGSTPNTAKYNGGNWLRGFVLGNIFRAGLGLVLLVSTVNLVAQNTYNYSTSTASTAWANAANWTGGPANTFPGTGSNASTTAYGASSDIAAFAGTLSFSGSTIGFNMGTSSNTGVSNNSAFNANAQLGALSIVSGVNKALIIGNSSATNGVLTLNGTTVNAVSNVIIRNNSAQLFTIQNNGGSTGNFGVALGNATNNIINIDGTGGITISSIISGANPLTKGGTGAGVLTLSGTNTYTGSTTVSGGTLSVSADANLGTAPGSATAGQLTLSGGTFQSTAPFTLSSNRGIALTTSTSSTIDVASATALTYGGIIAGSGNLSKTSAGTMSLTGANTFSGAFTTNSGTTYLGANGALGSVSSVTINTGALLQSSTSGFTDVINNSAGITFNGTGKLDLTGGPETVASISSGSSTSSLVIGDFIGTAGSFTVGDATSTLTFAGVISGTRATAGAIFTKQGSGTLVLSGTNTYTGITTVSAGTLSVSADANLGAAPVSVTAGRLTLSGGTLQSTATFTLSSNRGIALTSSTSSSIDVASATTLTYGGIIAGSGNLSKTAAGTLLLTGANTYTGSTTVSAGTLQLNRAGSGTLASTNNVTISGGTLRISTDQTINNLTMTSGTLQVDAGVVLTITGTYSASGGTVNNLGTIRLNGTTQSFPGSGVTVNNGTAGTLTNLTIGSSGAVTLTGSFTVSGALSLFSGSLDLNGNTLTLNSGVAAQSIGGAGSNSFTISSTAANGVVATTGSGSHTITLTNFGTSSGGGLIIGANTTLRLDANAELNVGGNGTSTSMLTVNNRLLLNSATSSNIASGTAPFYGNSSTLEYAVSYGPFQEWLAGAALTTPGVPQNVTISAGTVTMPNADRRVLGNLNITGGTFTLGTSGDLYVAGNWTRASAATFNNPSSRPVRFNGSGTQVITITGGGTASFAYLLVDKPSGSLQLSNSPATNVNVTASVGDVLQVLNAGALDLNGQTMTLSGTAGNISLNAGARNINSSVANGVFSITNGTKTVVSGGSLAFASNVTVSLSNGFNPGAGLTTINGTLQINSGGFVSTNAPTYGASSLLQYNSGTNPYGRGAEWTTASSGAGYPAKVQVSNNTTLDYPNGDNANSRFMASNLTVDAGSSFYMDYGTGLMTGSLTVGGSVNLNGNLSLGDGVGGDIKVGVDWSEGSAAVFTPNGRAVFLNGTGDQYIGRTGGTNTFAFLNIAKTGGTVNLINNITVNNVLSFDAGNTANIDPGGSTVIVSNNASGAVVRTGNGHVLGNLRRAIATGANTYLYPVGVGVNYTPASLAFTSVGTGGNVTVLCSNGVLSDYTPAPAYGLSTTKYVNRNWLVTNSGVASFSANATFTYVSGDLAGGAVQGNIKAAKFDSPNWTYPSTGTGTLSFTANSVTSFSKFTGGECGTITASAGSNSPICAGSNLTLTTSTPSGGTGTYTYSWAGPSYTSTAQNPTITSATTAATGTYTVTVTDGAGCTVSSTVAVTVNANSTPTVSIIAGPSGGICAGTSVTFVASANNTGGGTVTYIFKLNSSTVQSGASNMYTNAALVTGNTVSVDISITGGTCLTTPTASSSTITMTVYDIPQGSLTANGPFCTSGTGQLTFTASAGSGLYTIVYDDGITQRTVNNVVSGTPFNVFTNPVTSTTTYTLVQITDANCTRSSGFGGTPATITVNPSVTPTVSIAASPSGPICTGTSVMFTATAGNLGGGSVSNYNFKVNGSSVQSGGSNTYTTTTLANGNTVTCDITVTGGTCLTSTTATSNMITMVVNALPTLSGVSLGSTPCNGQNAQIFLNGLLPNVGQNITYTIGGGSPVTESVSSNVIGGAQLTPAVTSANNGQTFEIIQISTFCTQTFTMNNSVTLVVHPVPTATAPANQFYCNGQMTAAISLSGTPGGVTFDISGGAAVGLANQNGVTSVPSFTAVTGSATITITPKANGCTGSPVMYNITVNANPTAVISGNLSFCTGGSTTLTASGGSTYLWDGGSTNPVRVISTAGTYTVQVTDGNSCTDTETVTVTELCPDYTISTAGNTIVITDLSGNSDVLNITENGANINFAAAGRTYALNGGSVTALPANVPLAGVTSISVNAALGNDFINLGAFTANLPSLTINGGTGDDAVNFNGDITLAANANLDVDLQNDDATPGDDAVNIAADANLVLSGTGTATVKVSRNVTVNFRSSIETVNGNLTVEANQQAVPTTGSFRGVAIDFGNLKVSGTGQLTVKGKGGNGINGNQTGVSIEGTNSTFSSIEGGTGQVTVEGTGGPSQGDANIGILINNSNSFITSAGGDVLLTGQGGGIDGSYLNAGIYIIFGASISAGGTGKVTVNGTGGSSSGNNNYGVGLSDVGPGGDNSTITSSGGDVSVTGLGGGTGASVGNYGVLVDASSQITAGGSGKVTVQGTGGAASGNGNFGVYVVGDNTLITSSGGDVSVTGLGGGTGASESNYGVLVYYTGQITAGGSGKVTVQGTGGAASGNENLGVYVFGTDVLITSSGGDVSVTGIEGSGPNSTGYVSKSGGKITTVPNGGNITLIANSISIDADGMSTPSGNSVTLRPYTNGVQINLGSASNPIGGPLGLSDAELDLVTGGTLIIGNANSGTITVSADITRPASTNVQLISGGDVTFSGGGLNTSGGTLLLDPGTSLAAVKPTFNDTDATASTLSFDNGSDLAIVINGTTAGTQYNQLKVAGAVNLTGVDLVLSGSHTPVAPQTFTIVDNDDTEAITGTFTGLAEGAIIANFLGSALNAVISYVGGTGNDVVLTVQANCPTITFTASPANTCGSGSTGQIAITAPTGGVPPYMYSINNGTNYQAGATFTGLAAATYAVKIKDANSCESAAQNIVVGTTPLTTYYQDIDGDGLGDPAVSTTACIQPVGYVTNNTDACPLTVSSVSNSGNCGCSAGNYPVITVMSGQNVITGCQTCPAGSYCPDGLTAILCPAGQYSGVTGATECTPCAAGSYNPSLGATSCTPCEAGKFSNVTGSIACTPCPAGSYNPSTGATSCTPCEAGKFSNVTGSIACTPCPAGSYNPSTGATVCTPCEAGKFSDVTGSVACTPCPVGTFGSMTGMTICEACPNGTYNNNTGQTVCTNCPPLTFTATPNSICAGATNGQITITNAAGGAGPYTYSSNNGVTYGASATITGLTGGVYQVKIKDANGCESAASSVTVDVLPLPAATLVPVSSVVCEGGVVTLTFNESIYPEGATFSVSFNTNVTDFLNEGLVDGEQFMLVEGEDFNGSSTLMNIVVVSDMEPFCMALLDPVVLTVNSVTAGSIAANQTICSGGNPVAFTEVSAATGTALTYRWESSTTDCLTGFSPIGGATSATYDPPAGLTQTTYYYRVAISTLNMVMCEDTSNCVTVIVNPLPNAGTISGTPLVCVGSTTALTSNGAGGGTWSSSNGNASVSNLGVVTGNVAGTSIITYAVTDVNGCTSSTMVTVTVNARPNAGTISGTLSVCVGSTTALSSNGAGGGTWSSSNGNASVSNLGVVTGNVAGTSIITYAVTDVNGCTSSTMVTVTVNARPNAGTISGTLSVCVGSTTALSSNGAGGGTWSSSNGNAGVSNLGVVTGNVAGTSIITYAVTDVNGCTSSTMVTVTVNARPNAGTISGTLSVCVGSTTALSSNGAGGGTWSSSNGNASVSNLGVVTGNVAGTSIITYAVTDVNGCTSSTMVTVTVNARPNAGTISGTLSVCVGSTTALSSNGAGGGTWSSSNGNASVSNLGVVTGNVAGTSIITYAVTDVNGCTSSTMVTVTVNARPNAGTISGTLSVCVGSTTALSSNGVGGGTWSSSNGNASVSNLGVVTGNVAGTSIITYAVTDVNGCTSSTMVTVTVNTRPNAGTISGTLSVCVGSTTALSSNGAGGGTWSSSNGNASVSNLGVVTGNVAGTSIITYAVTDVNGCTSSTMVTVTVNARPNAGTISGTLSVCIGSTTALSSNGAGGGTWSSSNGNASVSNLGVVTGNVAGTSIITYAVTDVNGCTSSTMVTVTVNARPNAGTISGTLSVCVGSTTALSSNGAGGGTWSSSNGNASVSNLGVVTGNVAGTSIITYAVTDVNGCTSSTMVTVTVNGAPSFTSCPGAPVTANTGAGVCTAVVNYTVAATGSPSPTLTYAFTGVTTGSGNGTGSGSTFAKGSTNVVVTATNICSMVTCSFTVTVNDNVLPTAACKTAALILDGSGNASLAAADVNNASSDNCGTVTLSVSPNTFNCSNITPIPTDLFISEYVEGSGNNKYIEIYNPTASAINLGNYRLRLYPNGASSPSSDVLLTGSLPAGATIVYKNSAATIYLGTTTTNAAVNYNGNDAVVLYNNATSQNVDIFGRIGEDPGSAWTSGAFTTLDKTLRRKATVIKGVTTNPGSGFPTLATEWDQFNIDVVTGLGAHTLTIATNTVTLTVTDGSNNMSTCSASVTVQDATPPTLTCPANQAVNTSSNGTGDCAGAYTILNPASENCTGGTWQYAASGVTTITSTSVAIGTNSNAVTFAKGVSTITLNASDASGNAAASCSFTVTVTDNEAPTLTCPVAQNLTASGACTATYTIADPLFDNCTLATWGYSASGATTIAAVTGVADGTGSGSRTFNAGITTVVLTAVDAAGLTATSCSFTVTVTDSQTPTALCKNAAVVLDGTGNATLSASSVDNGSTDNCSSVSLSVSPSTFNCSNAVPPVPTELFFSEYVEGSGNNKYIEIYNPTASAVNLTGYQLRLYANGDPIGSPTTTSALTGSLAAGATIVYKNTAAAAYTGTATVLPAVNWNGNDAIGLFKVSANANVDIFGRIGNDPGAAWTLGGNTTVDKTLRRKAAVYQGITTNPSGTGAGAFTTLASEWDQFNVDDVSGLGSHTFTPLATATVTLTATDGNNLTGTCTATVTIQDATAPTLTCPANQTVPTSSNGTGDCTGSYTFGDPLSDNCSGATWSVAFSGNANGNPTGLTNIADGTGSGAITYQRGTTTVTLTAKDVSNNAATSCSFTVTLSDDEKPTLSGCPSNIALTTSSDGGADCLVLLNYTAPTYSDNCSGTGTATYVSGPTSGTQVSAGASPYTVVYTYTDAAGNAVLTNCSFTVTVQDNVAPTLSGCPSNTTLYTNDDGGADCQVLLTYTAPTYSDNCAGTGTASLLSGPASNTMVNVAGSPYTVVYTYSDPSNNPVATNCSFTVTVVDNTRPTLSGCPSNTTVYTNDDGGADCAVTLTYTAPTYSDNCAGTGSATYVYGPASGTPVNLAGSPYTVIYTYTDPSSNTVTTNCSFTVTVVDNTRPTLAGCPSNRTLYTNDDGGADCSVMLTYTAPTYSDNCSGTGTATLFSGPASGTAVNLGASPYTVVYTYSDGAGNTVATNCSFTVTVVDNTRPTLSGCPTNIALTTNDDGGADCAVLLTYTAPTYTDNCAGTGTATRLSGPASNTSVNLAGSPYTVVYTYTDPSSNTVTTNCSFTVTVTDNTKPTLSGCPTNIALTTNDDGGADCAVLLTYTAPTYTDNCAGTGTASRLSGPASGTPVNVAGSPYTVVYTYTDPSSNTVTTNCSFTVTVVDNTAPSTPAPCPGNQTIILNGSCQATMPDLRSGLTATDNCSSSGSITFVQSPAPGTTINGITPVSVTIKAMDAAGNMSTVACSFTVTGQTQEINVTGNSQTIADGDATPSLTDHTDFGNTLPGTPVVRTFTIQNTGTQPLTISSISSNNTTDFTVGPLSPASPIPAGMSASFNVTFTAVLPTGVKNATITINNNDCDEAVYDFAVSGSINCTFPAFSACPGNQTAATALNQCSAVVNYTAMATGIPAPSISYAFTGATQISGSGTGTGSAFNTGITTVVLTATNACSSTTCSFTVTVNDGQNPMITCPANIVRNTDLNLCSAVVTYAAPTFTDNCPGVSIVRTGGLASGSVFPKGTNMINWRATDAAGNTAICGFTVTVNDTQLPVIGCPANINKTTDVNLCTAVVTYTTPAMTDNCSPVGIVSLESGLASGSVFAKGATVIVWKATDGAGLTKTCSFTVTVTDGQIPVITCPANQTKNTDANLCTAVVTYTLPTATDNCGSPSVAIQGGLASGTAFPKGLTTVIWRATDGAGLTGTCSFRVTVNDTQAPTISCPANQVKTTDPGVCTAVATYLNATFTDNCPGGSVVKFNGLASGSPFPKGVNNVTFKATDASGNFSVCTMTITVDDAQPPSIVCPANIVVTGTVASGICSATVTYINPVGTDNCSGVTSFLQSGLASGSVYPVGTSTNVWRAVDLTGASSTCSFTVTVSCAPGSSEFEVRSLKLEQSPALVELGLKLAPNPAVASVTVSMDGVGERGGTLLVFDAMGRLVLRQVVAAGQRTAEINIDSAEFATGLYQVSLRTETGAVTKPLVVSKL